MAEEKTNRDKLTRHLAKIELTTRILVEGLQSGPHHSVFKGRGVEFTDLREYVPGDDIRTIDWNVTARFNHPFIREFTEERDQTFYFVLDVSGSGLFGSRVTRKEKMLEVFASLSFAAQRNNDRVGLCLFSDRVEAFFPARRGRKHILSLIENVITHKPASQKTDLSAALQFLYHVLKRKSSIIILSDFASPALFPVMTIMRKRHEVIAIRITDPREGVLPDIGKIVLEDPETGEQVTADTSDKNFQAEYNKCVRSFEKNLETGFVRAGIGRVTLSTDESYEIPLRRFFQGLRQRRT